MNGIIEAAYIFDEHKYERPQCPFRYQENLTVSVKNSNPILAHTYAARPLPVQTLLPLYLEYPHPRPNLVYLSSTNPPTLVFSIIHADLTYMLTSTEEIEPLLALEFLHRIVDVFEEFLGAPLLAHKIENNYHVAAQLLTEMCDAGTISTTEPNALRDLVEVEGWMGKLLGSINLPGKQRLVTSFQNSSTPSLTPSNVPALPWRRSNVRHTSNEMYADIIENLSVTLAPSGRPIAAFANGTVAFTSKVSGVPDIVLSLTCPTGKQNLLDIMELPVFHPCVRLQHWKERPGELSFIPPDGRFILAGYEVDLLPPTRKNGKPGSLSSNNLKLPVNVEVKTGLGTTGADFEVRVHVNKIFRWAGSSMSGSGIGSGGSMRGGAGVPRSGGLSLVPHAGTPANPTLGDLMVRVPLPAGVRNLSDIRPSRGDATHNPGDKFLEWHVPTKDVAAGTCYFGLKCTVMGYLDDESVDEGGGQDDDPMGFGFGKEYSYNEPYQSVPKPLTKASAAEALAEPEERDMKNVAQNKMLMPTSASVSFAVKGWLPSGIKVDSIKIDPRRSTGLGESVKPYKGVKYLTISKGGVEIRC